MTDTCTLATQSCCTWVVEGFADEVYTWITHVLPISNTRISMWVVLLCLHLLVAVAVELVLLLLSVVPMACGSVCSQFVL